MDSLINGEHTAQAWWELSKASAIGYAKGFADAGYHKQISGRVTEAYSLIKAVVTATEFANFFWLRDDSAADPTIAELARCMREAAAQSTPQKLQAGWWHLPYVDSIPDYDGRPMFFIANDGGGPVWLTVEDAIIVSCARCAAVSYRNEGYTLEKCRELYERLTGAERKHASALEHCATPMREYGYHQGVHGMYRQNHSYVPFTWEEGITHVDRKGQLWSGNLRGFIQHRKLIAGENYEDVV